MPCGTIDATDHDGKRVLSAFLDTNATEAFIRQAGTFIACGRFNTNVMRISRVLNRTLVEDVKLRLRFAAIDFGPAHHRVGKLKRTVLYSLGIKAAIGAEVNVFKEESKECFGDRRTWLINLHRDVRLCQRKLRYKADYADEPK